MTAVTTAKAFSADSGDMEQINRYTRRNFSSEEVYTFTVTLCDNEIDRDGERFTTGALHRLAELFVGKTGIFDHDPSGKNQSARIYAAEVVTLPERITSTGEAYAFLKARAYMVRSRQSEALITEIDGGIKKEVSIGCSMSRITCSICNADARSGCEHQKHKRYGGVLCHHILDEPSDAYEWSFVAVPAQKEAGVTKAFLPSHAEENIQSNEKERIGMRDFSDIIKTFQSANQAVTLSEEAVRTLSEGITELQKQAEIGSAYREELSGEVRRLAFLANEQIEADLLSSITQKLSLEELKGLRKAYELRLSAQQPTLQLDSGIGYQDASKKKQSLSEFKI